MRKDIAIVTTLLLIAAILLIINIPSFTGRLVLNTFGNGQTTKEITFSNASWDNTTYINIPNNTDIFYAYVTLHPVAVNGSYPSNVKLDVGGDGVDWEYNGAMISDQKIDLKNYIGNKRGKIPIYIYSSTAGEIVLKDLDISYGTVESNSSNTSSTLTQSNGTTVQSESKTPSTGISTMSISNDNWPVFRHDNAHTGYSYNSGPICYDIDGYKFFKNIPNPNELNVYGAATYNGILYVLRLNGNKTTIVAYDAGSDSVVWTKNLDGGSMSNPAVYNDVLYFINENGTVYALNASTGSLKWSKKLGNINVEPADGQYNSSPIVDGNILYVASGDTIYALNTDNGNILWNYETGGIIRSTPTMGSHYLFVGSTDGYIYAFDPVTGELKWRYDVGSPIKSTPLYHNGLLYVDNSTGLLAISEDTHNLQYKYLDDPAVGDPTLYKDILIFATTPSGSKTILHALNLTSQKYVWDFQLDNYLYWYSSPAVSSNGVLYVVDFGSYNEGGKTVDKSRIYFISATTGKLISSLAPAPFTAPSKFLVYDKYALIYSPYYFDLIRDDIPPQYVVVDYPENKTYTHIDNITVYTSGDCDINKGDQLYNEDPQDISKVIVEVDSSFNLTLTSLYKETLSPQDYSGFYTTLKNIHLKNGEHTLRVYSYDLRGHLNDTVKLQFTINDTTPPKVKLVYPPYESSILPISNLIAFNITDENGVKSAYIIYNGNTYQLTYNKNHGLWETNQINLGVDNKIKTYNMTVVATDYNGNTVHKKYNITIDLSSWRMYLHDVERTGSSNNKGPMSPLIKWKLKVYPSVASPVVYNGTIYVFNDSGFTLDAVNISDGTVMWKSNLGSEITISPLIYNKTIFLSSSDSLIALNISNGVVLWQFNKFDGSISTSPIPYMGLIYFGTSANYLYAINATTGKMVWNVSLGGPVYGEPTIDNSILNLVLYGKDQPYGVIYVGDNDGYLYAINAFNGNIIWEAPSSSGDAFYSPSYYHTMIFVGNADGNLYVFNSTNGELLWSFYAGSEIRNTPIVYGSNVYFTTSDGYLYSVNIDTHNLNWKKEVVVNPPYPDYFISPPVIANNGNIYVSSFNLTALDTNGDTLWILPLDGDTSNPPVLYNDTLLVTGDTYLYAIGYDHIPPKVNIMFPENGKSYTDVSKLIANATDNVGVTKVLAQVDSNNNKIVLSKEPGTTYYTNDSLDLSNGMHSIKVYAYDLSGNVKSADTTFYVKDIKPPDVVVLYPHEYNFGCVYNITLRVHDASGVSSVVGKLTYNGHEEGISFKHESGEIWDAYVAVCDITDYLLIINATDSVGNKRTVIYPFSIVKGAINCDGTGNYILYNATPNNPIAGESDLLYGRVCDGSNGVSDVPVWLFLDGSPVGAKILANWNFDSATRDNYLPVIGQWIKEGDFDYDHALSWAQNHMYDWYFTYGYMSKLALHMYASFGDSNARLYRDMNYNADAISFDVEHSVYNDFGQSSLIEAVVSLSNGVNLHFVLQTYNEPIPGNTSTDYYFNYSQQPGIWYHVILPIREIEYELNLGNNNITKLSFNILNSGGDTTHGALINVDNVTLYDYNIIHTDKNGYFTYVITTPNINRKVISIAHAEYNGILSNNTTINIQGAFYIPIHISKNNILPHESVSINGGAYYYPTWNPLQKGTPVKVFVDGVPQSVIWDLIGSYDFESGTEGWDYIGMSPGYETEFGTKSDSNGNHYLYAKSVNTGGWRSIMSTAFFLPDAPNYIDKVEFKFNPMEVAGNQLMYLQLQLNDNGLEKHLNYVLYNSSYTVENNTQNLWLDIPSSPGTWNYYSINPYYHTSSFVNGRKIFRLIFYEMSSSYASTQEFGVDDVNLYVGKSTQLDENGQYSFNKFDTSLFTPGGHWITVSIVNNNGIESSNRTYLQVLPVLIYINNPLDGHWYNSNSVNLNVSSNSYMKIWGYKIDNGNWISLLPGSTGVTQTGFVIPITGLKEGLHTIYVNGTTLSGAYNITNVTFGIDNTPPKVYIYHPLNYSHITNTDDEYVSFKAVDNVSEFMTCDLTVDLVKGKQITTVYQDTLTNVKNDTLNEVDVSFPQGNAELFVNCSDEAGNVGSNMSVFTVDFVSPETYIQNYTVGDKPHSVEDWDLYNAWHTGYVLYVGDENNLNVSLKLFDYPMWFGKFKYRVPILPGYVIEGTPEVNVMHGVGFSAFKVDTKSLIEEGKLNETCSDLVLVEYLRDDSNNIKTIVLPHEVVGCNTHNTTVYYMYYGSKGEFAFDSLFMYYDNPTLSSGGSGGSGGYGFGEGLGNSNIGIYNYNYTFNINASALTSFENGVAFVYQNDSGVYLGYYDGNKLYTDEIELCPVDGTYNFALASNGSMLYLVYGGENDFGNIFYNLEIYNFTNGHFKLISINNIYNPMLDDIIYDNGIVKIKILKNNYLLLSSLISSGMSENSYLSSYLYSFDLNGGALLLANKTVEVDGYYESMKLYDDYIVLNNVDSMNSVIYKVDVTYGSKITIDLDNVAKLNGYVALIKDDKVIYISKNISPDSTFNGYSLMSAKIGEVIAGNLGTTLKQFSSNERQFLGATCDEYMNCFVSLGNYQMYTMYYISNTSSEGYANYGYILNDIIMVNGTFILYGQTPSGSSLVISIGKYNVKPEVEMFGYPYKLSVPSDIDTVNYTIYDSDWNVIDSGVLNPNDGYYTLQTNLNKDGAYHIIVESNDTSGNIGMTNILVLKNSTPPDIKTNILYEGQNYALINYTINNADECGYSIVADGVSAEPDEYSIPCGKGLINVTAEKYGTGQFDIEINARSKYGTTATIPMTVNISCINTTEFTYNPTPASSRTLTLCKDTYDVNGNALLNLPDGISNGDPTKPSTDSIDVNCNRSTIILHRSYLINVNDTDPIYNINTKNCIIKGNALFANNEYNGELTNVTFNLTPNSPDEINVMSCSSCALVNVSLNNAFIYLDNPYIYYNNFTYNGKPIDIITDASNSNVEGSADYGAYYIFGLNNTNVSISLDHGGFVYLSEAESYDTLNSNVDVNITNSLGLLVKPYNWDTIIINNSNISNNFFGIYLNGSSISVINSIITGNKYMVYGSGNIDGAYDTHSGTNIIGGSVIGGDLWQMYGGYDKDGDTIGESQYIDNVYGVDINDQYPLTENKNLYPTTEPDAWYTPFKDYEHTISTDTDLQLVPMLLYHVNSDVSPILADGKLFTVEGDSLVAHSANDGSIIWSRPIAPVSSLTYHNGLVCVTETSIVLGPKFSCYNAFNGALVLHTDGYDIVNGDKLITLYYQPSFGEESNPTIGYEVHDLMTGELLYSNSTQLDNTQYSFDLDKIVYNDDIVYNFLTDTEGNDNAFVISNITSESEPMVVPFNSKVYSLSYYDGAVYFAYNSSGNVAIGKLTPDGEINDLITVGSGASSEFAVSNGLAWVTVYSPDKFNSTLYKLNLTTMNLQKVFSSDSIIYFILNKDGTLKYNFYLNVSKKKVGDLCGSVPYDVFYRKVLFEGTGSIELDPIVLSSSGEPKVEQQNPVSIGFAVYKNKTYIWDGKTIYALGSRNVVPSVEVLIDNIKLSDFIADYGNEYDQIPAFATGPMYLLTVKVYDTSSGKPEPLSNIPVHVMSSIGDNMMYTMNGKQLTGVNGLTNSDGEYNVVVTVPNYAVSDYNVTVSVGPNMLNPITQPVIVKFAGVDVAPKNIKVPPAYETIVKDYGPEYNFISNGFTIVHNQYARATLTTSKKEFYVYNIQVTDSGIVTSDNNLYCYDDVGGAPVLILNISNPNGYTVNIVSNGVDTFVGKNDMRLNFISSDKNYFMIGFIPVPLSDTDYYINITANNGGNNVGELSLVGCKTFNSNKYETTMTSNIKHVFNRVSSQLTNFFHLYSYFSFQAAHVKRGE